MVTTRRPDQLPVGDAGGRFGLSHMIGLWRVTTDSASTLRRSNSSFPLSVVPGLTIAVREIIQDPPSLARVIEQNGSTILQGTRPYGTRSRRMVKDSKILRCWSAANSSWLSFHIALRDLGRQVTNLYGPDGDHNLVNRHGAR